MTIKELYQIILDRKNKLPKDSYTASLFLMGTDRITQKVGEEAMEVIIAAKNESKKRLISEVADLVFHLLVLLAAKGVTPLDILIELKKRNISKKIKK